MAKARPKLKSAFNLGGEAAEADHLLDEAFYESSDFAVIESKQDHRCIVVGRTGAGKSAALQRLEEINPDHVIRINPENLSLPYITNLQAIRFLDSLEINLDTFWHTLWRHVLIVEILRHRYDVTSLESRNNVLRTLKEKIRNNRTKQAALAYLEEFEGQFWCEADERVRQITNKLTERLESEAGGKVGAPGLELSATGSTGLETSQEVRSEQRDRFQRVVNENQLARLNKMIDVLDENILPTPNEYRYVVIDDLDRNWVDERIANDLIRCLFAAVYGLQHVRHLKVLVALRTNIFRELDFGRKGGGQGEKLRALVLEMRWTRRDLELLLDERVKASADASGLPASTISEILPRANNTMGSPIDYLLDRTLLRPRDAIAFVNECLRVGVGKTRLAWTDIKTAERAYSSNRVLALRDEWLPTYPGIDLVIEKFRRASARMDRAEFQRRLDDVMVLAAEERDFDGVTWLTNLTQSMWSAGPDATWVEMYQPVVAMLYEIGLIGISNPPASAPVFHIDDAQAVHQASTLERSEYFYVHRTYQAGLDIQPMRGQGRQGGGNVGGGNVGGLD